MKELQVGKDYGEIFGLDAKKGQREIKTKQMEGIKMKYRIDWHRTHKLGDCDTVGRLQDGRWFWTWNTGDALDAESLLEMGSEDGINGGLIADSLPALLDEMEELMIAMIINKDAVVEEA